GAGKFFPQRRNEIAIEFDCHEAAALLQESRSQRASAGANLYDRFIGTRLDCRDDSFGGAPIDEKVLTKTAFRKGHTHCPNLVSCFASPQREQSTKSHESTQQTSSAPCIFVDRLYPARQSLEIR